MTANKCAKVVKVSVYIRVTEILYLGGVVLKLQNNVLTLTYLCVQNVWFMRLFGLFSNAHTGTLYFNSFSPSAIRL